MSEPKRTLEEKLKAIGGTVTAVTGLLTTVTGLLTAVKDQNEAIKRFIEHFELLKDIPPLIWYVIGGALIIFGFLALKDGLARRSRLLRPEALLLKANNPDHLKGRSEDIDRLSDLCLDYPQVHLVGESGAGKSALIQAGVLPRLKSEKKLLPIYINVWGQDWEKGPSNALINALWESLSSEERETLELSELPEPDNLFSILEKLRKKLISTPLIIFDQFDDYQARHRNNLIIP